MAAEVTGGDAGQPSFLTLCYDELEDEHSLLQALKGPSASVDGGSAGGRHELLRRQAAHMRTPDGRSALHRCVECGWASLAAEIVEAGGSPLQPGLGRSLNTPLHLAARRGHPQLMKALLAAEDLKRDPPLADTPNANGDTPLMFACASGNTGAAALLLAASASPVSSNRSGLTPLGLAASSGNGSLLLRLLLRHMADRLEAGELARAVASAGGGDLLRRAVAEDDEAVVALLLEAGCDPLARGASGRAVLEEARALRRGGQPLRCLAALEGAVRLQEEAAGRAAAELLLGEEGREEKMRRRGKEGRTKVKAIGKGRGRERGLAGAADAKAQRKAPGKGGGEDEGAAAVRGGDGDHEGGSVGDDDAAASPAEGRDSGDGKGLLQAGVLSSKEGDEADGAGVGWETVLGPQQRHPKQNPRDEGTSWRARGGGAASDRWRHGAARRPEAAKPVAADGAGLEGMASGSFLPARVQEAGIRTSRVLSAREGRLGASAVEDGFVGAAADEESPTPPSGDGWLAQAHEFVRLRHPKAASLEIEPHNILGMGVSEMSMSQLEVLEEIHHSLLERVAEARVRLSAIQRSAERLEAQRLAEEVHRAVSLASTGAQRSVPRPHRPQG